MKPREQPGFLGKKLGDHQTPLPLHLRWEEVGGNIISSTSRRKKWRPFWIVLCLALALIGMEWWETATSPIASSSEEAPMGLLSTTSSITADQPILSQTNEVTDTPTDNESVTPQSITQSITPSGASETFGTPTISLPPKRQVEAPRSELINRGLPPDQDLTSSGKPVDAFQSSTGPPTSPPATDNLHETPYPVTSTSHETITTITTLTFQHLFSERSPIPSLPRLDAPPAVTHRRRGDLMQVSAGFSFADGLPDDWTPLPAAYFSLSRHLNMGKGGFFKVGLNLNQTAWSSSLSTITPVNLYRPGTLDTIYRHRYTGAERVITTDSIAGLVHTEFTGYSQLMTLGATFSVGRQFRLLGGRIGIALGLTPSLIIQREGETTLSAEAFSTLENSNAFGSDFTLESTGEIGFDLPLTDRVLLRAEAGLRATLGRPLSVGNTNYRVWRGQLGLGLSYRLP